MKAVQTVTISTGEMLEMMTRCMETLKYQQEQIRTITNDFAQNYLDSVTGKRCPACGDNAAVQLCRDIQHVINADQELTWFNAKALRAQGGAGVTARHDYRTIVDPNCTFSMDIGNETAVHNIPKS